MAVNSELNKTIPTPSENFLIKFFKEIKAETKRITWASKEEVKKATAAVVVFTAIYVIYVALLDSVFSKLFKLIFK